MHLNLSQLGKFQTIIPSKFYVDLSDLWSLSYEVMKFCDLTGTQAWDILGLRFWILYFFLVSLAKILRFCKKNFDSAIIGRDMIVPLILRLSRIDFSLVWDKGESTLALSETTQNRHKLSLKLRGIMFSLYLSDSA